MVIIRRGRVRSQKKQPKPANKQGGRTRETDRIIPGQWPVELPFETKEQLNEYFATPQIICLLCGRKFHTLAKHLVFVHGVTADQYREKYGIPWSYGLSSPSASNNYANALKKRIARGDESLCTAKVGEVRHTGPREKVRQKCAADKRDNFLKLAKLTPRLHVEDDGTLWSEGPVDRRKKPPTIKCTCGVVFTRKSALATRQTMCATCSRNKRLERKKLARARQKLGL